MPKFKKSIDELKTKFDKWLYVIKNLNKFERIPDKLKEQIFEKLFEIAEIAKFNPQQMQDYEDSLKNYRDLKNTLDTAREEGKEEGRKEGRKEGREEGKIVKARHIAINLLKNKIPLEIISESTGLNKEEIEKLRGF